MEKHAILQPSAEGILAQMEPFSEQTGALACHATIFHFLSVPLLPALGLWDVGPRAKIMRLDLWWTRGLRKLKVPALQRRWQCSASVALTLSPSSC